MKKMKVDLDLVPDNGQMSLWASGGYMQMSVYDDLFNSEITYNVHPRHLQEINGIVLGDLVMTAEGDTGLGCGTINQRPSRFCYFQNPNAGKRIFLLSIRV